MRIVQQLQESCKLAITLVVQRTIWTCTLAIWTHPQNAYLLIFHIIVINILRHSYFYTTMEMRFALEKTETDFLQF